MRDRVLFVGQAPSRTTDGSPPFTGMSGRRLALLAGMEHDELLSAHDFVNLLSRWPGRGGSENPRGDSFPIKRAAWSARRLLPRVVSRGRRVVVLGRDTARAIDHDLGELPWFQWFETTLGGRLPSCSFSVMPHPSGVNRWWNEEDNVEKARVFLRDLLEVTIVDSIDTPPGLLTTVQV